MRRYLRSARDDIILYSFVLLMKNKIIIQMYYKLIFNIYKIYRQIYVCVSHRCSDVCVHIIWSRIAATCSCVQGGRNAVVSFASNLVSTVAGTVTIRLTICTKLFQNKNLRRDVV